MKIEDFLFDSPPFGQELEFLDDFDSEAFYANEELGNNPRFAGRAKTTSPNTNPRSITTKAKPASRSGSVSSTGRLSTPEKPFQKLSFRAPGSDTKFKTLEQARASNKTTLLAKHPNLTFDESGTPVKSQPISSEMRDDAALGLSQFVALNEAERRLADKIGTVVRKDLNPQLKAIKALLDESSLQTQATNEHNVINNTAAFRGRVLNDLYKIASMLPRNHPVRLKINAARLGLI